MPHFEQLHFEVEIFFATNGSRNDVFARIAFGVFARQATFGNQFFDFAVIGRKFL